MTSQAIKNWKRALGRKETKRFEQMKALFRAGKKIWQHKASAMHFCLTLTCPVCSPKYNFCAICPLKNQEIEPELRGFYLGADTLCSAMQKVIDSENELFAVIGRIVHRIEQRHRELDI